MFHNFFQPGKDAERDRRTRQLDLKARRADERLKRHSEEFSTKKVVRVADSVYVAIGYGLANCIMIEGKKIFFFPHFHIRIIVQYYMCILRGLFERT